MTTTIQERAPLAPAPPHPAAFVGSVGQRLLHVAPCPVLVVREPARVVSEQKAKVGA